MAVGRRAPAAINVVSVLILAHAMRGFRDVAPTLDEAFHAMQGSKREVLRDIFLPFFGKMASRFGVGLDCLEDRQMLEELK